MQKFKIKVGNEMREFNPITLKQYLTFLSSIDGPNFKDSVLECIGDLATDSTVDKISKEQAFVSLLALSTVEHPAAPYECECGKVHNVSLNYANVQQVRPVSDVVQSGMYSIGHFKVKLKYPTDFFADSNVYDLVLSCIDGIYTKNDVLQLDDLSDQEMDNFVQAITVDDVIAIRDYLLAPYIQIAVPVSCECGIKSVKVVKGLSECMEVLL